VVSDAVTENNIRGLYEEQQKNSKQTEEIRARQIVTATVTEAEAWLAVTPFGRGLTLELRAARAGRRAEVGGYDGEASLRRLTVSLGAIL
jgi:hypothetical protein